MCVSSHRYPNVRGFDFLRANTLAPSRVQPRGAGLRPDPVHRFHLVIPRQSTCRDLPLHVQLSSRFSGSFAIIVQPILAESYILHLRPFSSLPRLVAPTLCSSSSNVALINACQPRGNPVTWQRTAPAPTPPGSRQSVPRPETLFSRPSPRHVLDTQLQLGTYKDLDCDARLKFVYVRSLGTS